MSDIDLRKSASAEIWADDRLGRQQDARLLIDFLTARYRERRDEGRDGAYVINLDAGWGNGKTFFLQRLQRQLEAEGHLVAYVNAWRDDADGEPMTAVLAELRTTVEPFFGPGNRIKELWTAAQSSGAALAVAVGKGALNQGLKWVVGQGVIEVAEILNDATAKENVRNAAEDSAAEAVDSIAEIADMALGNRIAAHRKRQNSIGTFKEKLSALVNALETDGRRLAPMFVLLDELDRCRPSYAIRMLEETKHLFDVNGLVFIVATDTAQLAHAVRAIYGDRFEAERYLLRFFNRRYLFEEVTIETFVEAMFDSHKKLFLNVAAPFGEPLHLFFTGVMRHYDLSLRDAEHCFDVLRSFVITWDKPIPIQLIVVLPLIALFHLRRMKEFSYMSQLNFPNEQDPLSGYTTEVSDVSDFGKLQKEYSIGFNVLLKSLLSSAKQGLPDALYGDGNDGVSRWVFSVLQEEFNVLHRSRSNIGEVIPSVLCDYGARVQGVSRLTKT